MHIVHISSVHSADDPRIRRKMLGSVVAHGWRATLITGDEAASEGDGVRVVRISSGRRSRGWRLLVMSPRTIFRALRENADVYHLHDPELLPWAWLLLLRRRPVVYDVHEDYVTSLRQKEYLPKRLRPVIARLLGAAELVVSRPFYRVIAERYYRRRFPDAKAIQNYPTRRLADTELACSPESSEVLYTGNLTADRGALQMARLVRVAPEYCVTAMGYCSEGVARAIRQEAGDARDRLRLFGVGRYVPFHEIQETYRCGGWLAGLALFPDTDHYREKELTKFFEYMAAGLPIVASDFPVWRNLLVEHEVGLCVDPEDAHAIRDALDWLRANPARARAMGENGRRLIMSRYNWEREGRALIAFYRELAGRDSRPGVGGAAGARDRRAPDRSNP